MILAEVLQGFRQNIDFEAARLALSKFNQTSLVSPILAIQSARTFRFLRQKGITVRKTIDGLLATYCIENSHDLLHNDSDDEPYEQLGWLFRLSIGFGMNFGLLFPSCQRISEFASQKRIESEKTAHRRSPKNRYL